jgi:hypothetical protein
LRDRRWFISALLVFLAGCSNTTGPVAGVLDVTLSTPRQDDGAVLFLVYGGPVDSIVSVGYPIYSARSADTLKAIATGQLAAGVIARLYVPDTRLTFRYAASIGQVAERGTYTPHGPPGYTVSLVP